jgi:signal transduction histidine kinase
MDPTVSAAERAAVYLRPDAAEMRLVERGVAVARALLIAAAFLVGEFVAPDPTGHVQILLLVYAIAAIGLVIVLLGATSINPRVPAAVHVLDVAFAAALTLYPNSLQAPFFSMMLFPLFTAACRWGFIEVMATASVLEAVMAVETVIDPRLFVNTFLPRAVAIGAAAAAMGYLAEHELRRRFEDRAIAVVLGRARLVGTLGDTMSVVLASLRHAFRAKQVLLVLQEQPSGRLLLWKTALTTDEESPTHPEQLPAARRDDYLFEIAGDAWHVGSKPFSRGQFNVIAVDAFGRRRSSKIALPARFLEDHPCRRLIGAVLQLSGEWVGRVFVIDPAAGVHPEQNVRFALQLAQRIGPAMYDHYLVRRLRMRAQALERSRIARELHDGVTQSLLGLEMEIVVLRRRAVSEAPQLVEDLARVHGIVRDEVVTVRELMEGIRVDDVETGDLVNHLNDVVDRFGRHTGIAARFVSDGRPAPLTPYARRQLARIVHEALVNVRKHSGADRVLVRASTDERFWKLSIEDDGRGFPFAGRRTHAELEALRLGPRTIGERARIIGGEISVESRPGFGSCVEIIVPLEPAQQEAGRSAAL